MNSKVPLKHTVRDAEYFGAALQTMPSLLEAHASITDEGQGNARMRHTTIAFRLKTDGDSIRPLAKNARPNAQRNASLGGERAPAHAREGELAGVKGTYWYVLHEYAAVEDTLNDTHCTAYAIPLLNARSQHTRYGHQIAAGWFKKEGKR